MRYQKLFVKLCCAGLLMLALAQTNSVQAQSSSGMKAKLTEESVVKDSSGAVYTATLWKSLLSTGWYVIRPKDAQDEHSEFLLVRLSEEDYKRRMNNAPKPRESAYFTTGKPVSTFTATDLDGNKYKLKDLKGKVVVMNFWFIACQPCQAEMPELNKLVAEFKDSSDVVFLAICLDDKGSVEDFLEKKAFDYNIIANGRFITSQYGINSYPTHLVVDREGNVSFHSTGYSLALVPWLRKTIREELE